MKLNNKQRDIDMSSSASTVPMSDASTSSSTSTRSFRLGSKKGLKRYLLPFNKSKREGSAASNTVVIDGSKKVPSKVFWDQLKNLHESVSHAEARDLLLQSSFGILPVFHHLYASSQLESLTFLDKVDSKRYVEWKHQKDFLMEEGRQIRQQRRSPVLIFQAMVSFPKGSKIQGLEEFLSDLHGDVSCGDVSFLTSTGEAILNQRTLHDLIDASSSGDQPLRLKEPIYVVVSCGWFASKVVDGLKLLEQATKTMSKAMLAHERKNKAKSSASHSSSSDTTSTTIASTTPSSIPEEPTNQKENASSSKFSLNTATTWEDYCLQNRQKLYAARSQRLGAQQRTAHPTAA